MRWHAFPLEPAVAGQHLRPCNMAGCVRWPIETTMRDAQARRGAAMPGRQLAHANCPGFVVVIGCRWSCMALASPVIDPLYFGWLWSPGRWLANNLAVLRIGQPCSVENRPTGELQRGGHQATYTLWQTVQGDFELRSTTTRSLSLYSDKGAVAPLSKQKRVSSSGYPPGTKLALALKARGNKAGACAAVH
jgi:hypothetical protein